MNTPEKSPFKGYGGLGRIVRAMGYSFQGFKAGWRHEAAFRQACFLSVCLVALAFYLPFSKLERALLVAVSLLPPLVELLNSAIEAVVDRISLEHHPLSGRAKDLGSAAQLWCLGLVACVWWCVWPT